MILEIRQLCKSFYPPEGRPIQVLKDVSFNLDAGQTRAVVGQSGSGKTTLLSLIAGLDSPDSGRVIMDGEDLAALDEKRLTRYRAGKIGIIFQQFHLMPHLSARENISLPLEIMKSDRIRERTGEMLEKVGLVHRQHHLPARLSGGECQRVAIARALVIRPTLLLADEPTGNLDAKTGDTVADLLFDLVGQDDRALVLVTHNPDLADRCHGRLHLEKGRLS